MSLGASLRRFAANALSLLTSDVLNRATSFLIYALVARQLGTVAFGQVSLAFTLFYVFQVMAVAGLKTLIIREVAKDRGSTERYLTNGVMTVTAYALGSLGILYVFVRVMNYRPDTARLILLLSLGLIPYAISAMCEAVFQAWERMHYIAFVNAPVNVLKLTLVIVVLTLGLGVQELMIVIVTSLACIAGVEWWMAKRFVVTSRAKLDLGFARDMARRGRTFLGIDVVIAVWAALPVVLLSKLAGERAVGLYSAAQQLLVPIGLVFQAVALSVFPILCRKFAEGLTQFRAAAGHLLEVLLILALPAAVGLFILGDSALLLVYRDAEFLNSVSVLRILVWSIVLNALTTSFGQLLYASNQERMTLRIVITNLVVSFVLGVALISAMGVQGAAIATLVTGLVNTLLHVKSVWTVIPRFMFGRRIWLPITACLIMGGMLEMAPWNHLLFLIVTGMLSYAAALLGIMTISVGGPRQIKARYLALWSR